MRRWLDQFLFLLFALRLSLVLVTSSLQVLYRSFQPFWWTLALGCWLLVVLVGQTQPLVLPSVSPVHPLADRVKQLPSNQVTLFVGSPDVLARKAAELFQLYQLQPTHRDVLLNLALLLEHFNQPTATYFWQESKNQDPNALVFSVSTQ